MSWRDYFVSRHARWLEEEVVDLKLRHERELAALRTAFQTQLDSVTLHNKHLQDELQRTRILLTPGLGAISLPQEQDQNETPPPEEITPTGTPWQRVQAREIAADLKRWREAQVKTSEKKESIDGVSGQVGSDAPQRVPGKTA